MAVLMLSPLVFVDLILLLFVFLLFCIICMQAYTKYDYFKCLFYDLNRNPDNMSCFADYYIDTTG